MKNEQSVFDTAIDPLIFYSDVSLDNQHYLAQYYNLIKSGDYVGASDYIQSIEENVDFYGAWLLNLYENELYAIETNMYKYVTPQHKPKLTFHGSSEPTDSEFKTWVYCDINPGIPEPVTPPTPPMPDHVYFENGRFNSNLVPSGFNFNNNVAIYDYDDDWNRLIWDGDYHDDAVNGTIARLKVNSSASVDEKWVLTNNALQFIHTQDPDPYAEEYRGEVLFLPVSGWRPAYNYTCIEYSLTTDDGEELDWILYINTYCYDDWLLEEGQYCYDDCPG